MKARDRVVFSSLYLGTGHREEELVRLNFLVFGGTKGL